MNITDKDLADARPIHRHNSISRYMSFINSRGHAKKPKDGNYYEHHHIVLKNVNPDDRIYLTHREHVLAHWMLYRIFNDEASARGFAACCNVKSGNWNKRVAPKSAVHRAMKNAMKAHAKSGVDHWTYSATKEQLTEFGAKLKGRTWTLPDDVKERAAVKLALRNTLPEWKERCMKGAAKNNRGYKLTNPEGKEFTFEYGIDQFCRDNNLSKGNIWQVAKGARQTHKGWTAEFLRPEGTLR